MLKSTEIYLDYLNYLKMNKLYQRLLSHGFTIKKVGEIFVLAKDNVSFVEKGRDMLEAFLIISDKDAKLICSDIKDFDRVKSIYYGITGKPLEETTYAVEIGGEDVLLNSVELVNDLVVLDRGDGYTVKLTKGTLYKILERVENEVVVKSSTPIIKRILNRINLL